MDYQEKYKAPIKLGLEDSNENVREFLRMIPSNFV